MSDNQFHNAVNQALNFKMPALDIRGIGSSQPTRLDRGLVFDKSEQPLLSGNLGTIQNTNAKVNPNFKRVKPKIVRQFGKETCWAAALESWFSAINDALRQRTQSELLKLI